MFFLQTGQPHSGTVETSRYLCRPAKPSDGLPGALCTAAHGSEGIGSTTSTTGHSCHHQDKRHLFMAFCTGACHPGNQLRPFFTPDVRKELAPPGVERSFLCPNYTWFSCLTGSLGSFLGGFFFLFPCEISGEFQRNKTPVSTILSRS